MFESYIIIFIKLFLLFTVVDGTCLEAQGKFNFKFYLVKTCQRSLQERLFVDNVNSLEACKMLARKHNGMAFNYSPRERFLKQNEDGKTFYDHFWHRPHLYFNCHILQCPENQSFKTMITDTSFDYFSLYENAFPISEYKCLPEVGLFMLRTIPETFQSAALHCRHSQNNCGSLAHIASQKRTETLTSIMVNYNDQQVFQIKAKVYLAYVGLHYNSTLNYDFEFFNEEKQNLKCFNYRAWQPGSPTSDFNNSSCVALTLNRSWKTVKCERKLPFICEISSSCKSDGKALL